MLVSYTAITIIIGLWKTKKGNFTIASDWVVEKKNRVYGSIVIHSKPYRLIFAKGGEYNMFLREYYAWSNLYATTPRMICELTDINDEFYVISVGTQKNVMAYNKKRFELKEQIQ